jgi:hypothetical protein
LLCHAVLLDSEAYSLRRKRALVRYLDDHLAEGSTAKMCEGLRGAVEVINLVDNRLDTKMVNRTDHILQRTQVPYRNRRQSGSLEE